MSDRGWKQFELRCAVALGTKRIPATGEPAGADLENAMFAVQCKRGRRCPEYLQHWLAGIRAAGASRSPSKVGVVVWKPKGGRDRDALVVLAFADWCGLHGSAGRQVDATMARQSAAMPSNATICALPGCGNPQPPTVRRRGGHRRFCSAACRSRAWDLAHPPAAAERPPVLGPFGEELAL